MDLYKGVYGAEGRSELFFYIKVYVELRAGWSNVSL